MPGRLTFLSCDSISFFDLTEHLATSPPRLRLDMSRPFHRICELMRKCGAKCVLVHRTVHAEPYYDRQYPHLRQLKNTL